MNSVSIFYLFIYFFLPSCYNFSLIRHEVFLKYILYDVIYRIYYEDFYTFHLLYMSNVSLKIMLEILKVNF